MRGGGGNKREGLRGINITRERGAGHGLTRPAPPPAADPGWGGGRGGHAFAPPGPTGRHSPEGSVGNGEGRPGRTAELNKG